MQELLPVGTDIPVNGDTVRIEIKPHHSGGIVFDVHTTLAVQRTHLYGWIRSSDTIHQRKLLERLEKAIRAGVVITYAKVRLDTNGMTYVATTSHVCRHLNADLKKLGY